MVGTCVGIRVARGVGGIGGGPGVRVGGFENWGGWAVGGMTNVGNGVTESAGVLVGRRSTVGEVCAVIVAMPAAASGVRIVEKLGSRVGVGGIRVVAPTGVDVNTRPAADTMTTAGEPEG